jgi:Sulfotransferase domain
MTAIRSGLQSGPRVERLMRSTGVVTAELSLGPTASKKIMVVSHERSGTHLLMNALELNLGFVADPWLNLDYELGVNLYSHHSLCFYLMNRMHNAPVLNIVKSHHQLGFFAPILPYLTDQFHIFYIYRDPRDVMVSFWRYIWTHTRDEGPRTETVGAFMRAEPSGGMLRYQKKQVPTVLERWKVHVEEWVGAADRSCAEGICLVRYEELCLDFEATIDRIARHLERPWSPPARRPDPRRNTISPGSGSIGSHRAVFEAQDHEFIATKVGSTMRDLHLSEAAPT